MAFFAKNNLRLYLTFQLSLRSVHMLKIILVSLVFFFFFCILVIRRKIDYQNYN